jgi:hypothetical protein
MKAQIGWKGIFLEVHHSTLKECPHVWVLAEELVCLFGESLATFNTVCHTSSAASIAAISS